MEEIMSQKTTKRVFTRKSKLFLILVGMILVYYVYFLSIRYFIINFILVLNFLKLILVKSVLFLNAFYKYYILTEGFYYKKSKKLIIN